MLFQCCYFRHLIRSVKASTNTILTLSPLKLPHLATTEVTLQENPVSGPKQLPEGGTVSLVPVCLPPPPPLERTKGPPENQQKLSLAYVTAASHPVLTVSSSSLAPFLELTEKPMQCNVCTKK